MTQTPSNSTPAYRLGGRRCSAKSWLRGAAMAATLMLCQAAAHAAGVLLIGPVPNPTGNPTPVQAILNNLVTEFQGATYVGGSAAGAITSTTFDPNYDVVVVLQPVSRSTMYDVPSFDPGNLSAIMTAIENRKAKAFVIIADTGGTGRPSPFNTAVATSANDLVDRINNISGLSVTVSGTTTEFGQDANMAPNIGSPFSSGFSTLRGGYFHYLRNVPAANTLLMKDDTNTNPNPASGPQDNVYAVFIPSAQSYGGKGACVMAFTDLTMVEPDAAADKPRYSSNEGKIGPPIKAAALGACSLAVDLTPAITGPTVPPVGTPSTYTVVITNQGALASTNGTVTITLPPNMTLSNTVPTGCARVSDTQLRCDLSTIAPGGLGPNGTTNIAFGATANGPVAGTAIGVTISAVNSEVVTTNNSAQLPLGPPASVPTLGEWGLLLMSLAMAGLGMQRRRQQRA